MYAEAGLLWPLFQSFLQQENLPMEEFCGFQKINAGGNMLQTSAVAEYDLGAEGDLFKAPKPINAIMETPVLDLDPISAALSMITSGEDVTSGQTIEVDGMDSLQSGPLLSEVFYECRKDLLAKSAILESSDDIPDVKVPCIHMDENLNVDKSGSVIEGSMQKSVSSGCLTLVEWINGGSVRPNFLDFQGVDLGAFRMRRAFSENDIQTFGNVKTPVAGSPFEPAVTIANYTIEERKQKLSRYRKKKSKRNFGRKIKYACRKALADSQPRIRGRFAKTEEAEASNLPNNM